MKNRITFLRRSVPILMILAGFIQANAQVKNGLPAGSDFRYFIANETRVGKTQIEFDLLLLNMDPYRPFELGSVQAGILINPAIYNGGIISAAIVPGTSDLNASQSPKSITFVQSQNCIKLASMAPPGFGGGSILSSYSSSPTRVCKIRLTNSNSWSMAQPELHFCFTTKPYPTKISRYISETGQNVAQEIVAFNSNSTVNSGDTPIKAGRANQNLPDGISVSPNPNNGDFELAVTSGPASTYNMIITDNHGKIVYRQNELQVEGTWNQKFHLDTFPNGVYTIFLNNETSQLTSKMVINR